MDDLSDRVTHAYTGAGRRWEGQEGKSMARRNRVAEGRGAGPAAGGSRFPRSYGASGG